ncbi:rhodanese-like domain-containing protein, partial [Halomonas sp. SIMBA_159]
RMSEVPLRGRAETASAATTSEATSVPARPAVPHVAADALDDEVTAGAFVLDVREADEVAFGAIPGSRHAPLAEVLGRPGAFS